MPTFGFYQPGLELSAAVLAAMLVECEAREVALFACSGCRLTDRIENRIILDLPKQSLHRATE
jgi:uncharacterized metal-binding protein